MLILSDNYVKPGTNPTLVTLSICDSVQEQTCTVKLKGAIIKTMWAQLSEIFLEKYYFCSTQKNHDV